MMSKYHSAHHGKSIFENVNFGFPTSKDLNLKMLIWKLILVSLSELLV